MIDVLFRKKRRGVKVKGESRLLENIFLVMLIFLHIYLLNFNFITNYYKVEREENSTPVHLIIGYNKIEEEEKQDIKVYDNMTLEELSEKINRSLNSTISGKGDLIASYSLEKEVDPYLATAIMLHETGCKWNCSYLVNSCNNVGGQKGQGCGSYSYFNSLDDGIKAFIDNIKNNYVNYGLTTAEQMNSKYAEDPNWSINVNKYIEMIKTQ